ncbi:Na+/H+ antiporter subunit E [sulfur-oxidizing endosymbiont of Gigantopelta aegis]|uniref:Na+/H+ antiporter subunit E n=1 Tax=sulfur-oxidizing endosymbiont of Gigantopelta aegis TaxID=2794934 RepID=UPI0018DB5CDA|nr:Na+/H+ antiporter subunit E [sulfur-oxidizing endosymbiont of Gigantopelta aegis]
MLEPVLKSELEVKLTLFEYLKRGWLRGVFFSFLWLILTEGVISSLLVGIPVVLLATWSSVLLLPPITLSLLGILKFIPFFLWHSLLGGVDTARRVLRFRMQISPGMHDYPWSLPPGMPRVFMANTVSLFPGTMSAELTEDYLRVHVLDDSSDFISELRAVEQSVAILFKLS